jgi:hypothetical protein
MKTIIKTLILLLVTGFAAALMLTGTANATNTTTDLMWFNRNTGEVSTWQLNGYGNVLAKQDLDWYCDYTSGCSSEWSAVDLVR